MYNKLFTKILDSSIWLESTATRIVWLTFIAVMDELGFAQFAAVGNVAHRARVTLDEAQEAIRCLEGPDPESSDPDNDGRRLERVPGGWLILNAEKHRAMVTRSLVLEQTRLRVKLHRERKRKGNAPVTPSEAEADTRSGSDPETKQKKKAEEPRPRLTGSKRPIYTSDRFAVFEWQLDELGKVLGAHFETFDLHAFFDDLSQKSRAEGLVIPKADVWAWLQTQVTAEAKRRGLLMAKTSAASPVTRTADVKTYAEIKNEEYRKHTS